MRSKKDILGIACSGLCMVHCLGLPIFVTVSLSSTGLAYLFSESTHFWLNILMLSIAVWVFPNGWQVHKTGWPSLLALVGAGLMAMATTAPENDEFYWVMASGVCFIFGHLLNRHLLIMKNISDMNFRKYE
jgi:hypothetical protein